ncbi:uncharacterized protein N7479_002240 [Penicillium vulpinum]|nr:uncharacterized protein N7479_002240 [Penicillium vulpinum]KAJ5972322.1 hypothetical protein N7479_002240 [Penicillium vulpinum]
MKCAYTAYSELLSMILLCTAANDLFVSPQVAIQDYARHALPITFAVFGFRPSAGRALASELLRNTLTATNPHSYAHWQATYQAIAETMNVTEVGVRRAMVWDNRVLLPRDRGAAVFLD